MPLFSFLKKKKKTNKYSPIVVETKQEFLSENVEVTKINSLEQSNDFWLRAANSLKPSITSAVVGRKDGIWTSYYIYKKAYRKFRNFPFFMCLNLKRIVIHVFYNNTRNMEQPRHQNQISVEISSLQFFGLYICAHLCADALSSSLHQHPTYYISATFFPASRLL